MSRNHQDVLYERAEGRGGDGMVIWDMGSSLYDSYELASLCRILDRHIDPDLALLNGEPPQEGLAAGAAPPSVGSRRSGQEIVAVRGRAERKVTLRALFRAAACWATRPSRKARGYGCACVGAARGGGAVEPVVATPGNL